MKKIGQALVLLLLAFGLIITGCISNDNGGGGEEEPYTPVSEPPYNITNNLTQDSSTGFLAQWHNDKGVSSQKLQIVTAGGDFANAQTITVSGKDFAGSSSSGGIGNYAARKIFRAEVTGLTPNTEYKYRMGDDDVWSETFYYKTSSGSLQNFSFTVVTDPQDGVSGGHKAMEAALTAANAYDSDNRFFLMCGDIVDDIGKFPQEIVNYTKAANKFNIRTPITATQGNHDTYLNVTQGDQYVFNEGRAFNAFITFPGNGHQYAADTNMARSHSYYFYYNEVLFISLNTMFSDNNQTAQLNWFKDVLQKDKDEKKSKYIIVFTHVSPFSPRDWGRWLANQSYQYAKVAADFDVDIFFSGHDHMYARSNPIKLTSSTMGRYSDSDWNAINWNTTEKGTVFSVASTTGPKIYFTRVGAGSGSGEAAGSAARLQSVRTAYPAITETEAAQSPGMFINVKVTAAELKVNAMRVNNSTPVDTYTVTAKR